MKNGLFYLSIAAIIGILTFSINIPDFDLWARLAVGSIFFQTGTVLKHDIFSYLPTKELWIDHEWGSGVVFYFLTRYAGDAGLFALKAMILFAIFILIIKIIKLQSDRKSPGVLFFILMGFSLYPGFANLLRCQIFTYLFFTLWIYLLEKVRKEDHRFIWMFPVTMLCWVNLHGGFIAGAGLILIYASGELLNRKNILKYLGILALILPVTLLNPYNWQLWTYMTEAAFMPRPFITEWEPVNLSGPFHSFAGIRVHMLAGFLFFVILTLFTGIKMIQQKEKPDWIKILLAAVLLYLSVRHQRHTAFFLLAIPALFYHQYHDLFKPVERFIHDISSAKLHKTWGFIKHGSGYLLLALICVYSFPRLSTGITVNPLLYPVGSLKFIKQNNISGNLASTYGWGSYAFWKLYPQCKVMIDGRYEEVYPDDLYRKAMQFSEHTGNWQEILREYPADILVLSKHNYSPADILMLRGWKPVYQDLCSVVLLPESRMKLFYIYPDYHNPLYSKEDLSRKISAD